MINLNYLIDHILYQTFKIILRISSNKHETLTDNHPIKIIWKTGNRITFKTKAGYYIQLLIPETWNNLEALNKGYWKKKNGEIVPHL